MSVRLSALLASVLVAIGLPIAHMAPASSAALKCLASTESVAEAIAMAAACGEDVAVDSSRSEYSQVVAAPDGGTRFESAVLPQRARQANGAWADIDLSLAKSPDGLYRPRVSIADIAFSGGGSTPLVMSKRSGKAFNLSWQGSLPTPVASGDSLTYRGVLRDVDLIVRATRTGFTHVLVVKSPAAGRNPAIRRIRLGVDGDVELRRFADGPLQAVAGSTVVATGTEPVMWDSSFGPGAVEPTRLNRSSAAGAGDFAQVKRVGSEVDANGGLVLLPDSSLLRAAAAYPVFIDPAWSYGEGSGQKWAYANSANATNENSVARVGKSPDHGHVYRSFFEFPTTSNGVSLQGKHIQSAYVQMNLTHSHACDNQWNYMYLTPVINATPKASWSAMTLSSFLAAQQGHANEAGGCGSIRPNMIMNYAGSAVTGQVQVAANDGWNTITVGFAARDTNGGGETTITRWMKFIPEDAKLIVDYDSKPTAPHSLQVARVACLSSGVLTIGTLNPTVSAIHPDADSGQSLSTAYEWIEVPTGGMGVVTDTSPNRRGPPYPVAVTAGGRAETAPFTGLVQGKVYAFRGKSTDPAPYNKVSPWSVWCQFKVDDQAPQVSVSVVTEPSGPGKPGTFEVRSSHSDVTKFKWGWGAATKEVAAPSAGEKKVTITATAPKYGRNILNVSAVDTALNEGFGSAEFIVGRPSPAVARWAMEAYPHPDQTAAKAAALADQQPSLAGNTPLAPVVPNWDEDVRLIDAETFSMKVGAGTHAKTTVPVVDTSRSFSVALWVRVQPCAGGSHTVASADGSRASAFMLDRWCGTSNTGKWRLATHTADADGGGTAANAWSTTVGADGRWQHVAAVYDSTDKQTRLYIDGVLEGSANVTGIFQAAGPFVIGRGRWNGNDGQFFRGHVAEAQVFDRVLVEHDFTGMLATDPDSGGFHEPGILTPVKVGEWDFEAATPCYTADYIDTCEAPEKTSWQRWLALSRGSAVGAGHHTNDSGLWLDRSYFPDEEFDEPPAQETARSAYQNGSRLEGGEEYRVWQDTPVLRTDQSFTVAAWINLRETAPTGNRTFLSQDGNYASGFYLGTRVDQNLNQHQWAFMMPDSDAMSPSTRALKAPTPLSSDDAGRWTHVAAVYDASRKQMRLYIDGVLKGALSRSATPWQAAGPLVLGRAKWNGVLCDGVAGGIDEVVAFQAAMTDTAIFELYNSQVAPKPGTSTLYKGEKLVADQKLRSAANNYALVMQGDGNLVLYQAGYAIWDSGTWGNPGSDVLLQSDGNLVLHRTDDVPIWSTGTYGKPVDRLVLQDDGNLVLLGSDGQTYWQR